MSKSIHRPEYDLLRHLLRQIRMGVGVTQEVLSGQLGRSQSFISDIERGVRRIDVLELRDVCLLLDTNIAAFIGELERQIDAQNLGVNRSRRRKGSASKASIP